MKSSKKIKRAAILVAAGYVARNVIKDSAPFLKGVQTGMLLEKQKNHLLNKDDKKDKKHSSKKRPLLERILLIHHVK